MATFQIENGTCTGRGFAAIDTDGYLAKFYTWVTKSPAAGGPGWYIIDDQSALGTDPYIVISDVASTAVNEYNTGQSGGPPKYQRIRYLTSQAAIVRVDNFMWWDTVLNSGIDHFSGYQLSTVDAGDFAYDFRGGAETMIQQTRIGIDWDSAVLDDWVGDANLVEGPDVISTLQEDVSAPFGTGVLVTLAGTDASLFTANKWYYMTDFSIGPYVSYVKCLAVSGVNQLSLDYISRPFSSGTLIGAYPHRIYTCSNFHTVVTQASYRRSTIPYVSSTDPSRVLDTEFKYITGNDHWASVIYGGCETDVFDDALSSMSPNDEGLYAVQRPFIGEYTSYYTNSAVRGNYMNRYYGVAKNMYVTILGSMARAQDGRIINSGNWLYFMKESELWQGGLSSNAILYRDTESLT